MKVIKTFSYDNVTYLENAAICPQNALECTLSLKFFFQFYEFT